MPLRPLHYGLQCAVGRLLLPLLALSALSLLLALNILLGELGEEAKLFSPVRVLRRHLMASSVSRGIGA